MLVNQEKLKNSAGRGPKFNNEPTKNQHNAQYLFMVKSRIDFKFHKTSISPILAHPFAVLWTLQQKKGNPKTCACKISLY